MGMTCITQATISLTLHAYYKKYSGLYIQTQHLSYSFGQEWKSIFIIITSPTDSVLCIHTSAPLGNNQQMAVNAHIDMMLCAEEADSC